MCHQSWRTWCHLGIMQGPATDLTCWWWTGIASLETKGAVRIIYTQSNSIKTRDHSVASNPRQPATTSLWLCLHHGNFFDHFGPSVRPISFPNTDFEPSPSNSTKNLQDKRLWFWSTAAYSNQIRKLLPSESCEVQSHTTIVVIQKVSSLLTISGDNKSNVRLTSLVVRVRSRRAHFVVSMMVPVVHSQEIANKHT